MDLEFWLLFAPLGLICWWLGYIATKRMRLNKHKK